MSSCSAEEKHSGYLCAVETEWLINTGLHRDSIMPVYDKTSILVMIVIMVFIMRYLELSLHENRETWL